MALFLGFGIRAAADYWSPQWTHLAAVISELSGVGIRADSGHWDSEWTQPATVVSAHQVDLTLNQFWTVLDWLSCRASGRPDCAHQSHTS